jgi:6-phosphogluconolactonase
VALAFGASAALAAKHHSHKGGVYAAKPVGFVYTETNASPDNQVLIFDRYANGSLKQAGAVSTGGTGGHEQQGPCNPPGGCPSLDTQNEVGLAPNGKLLFVVNAGSNNITSFRVTRRGLRKVSLIDSGGVFPNSLTVHGNVLYVLNSNSDNIAGFRFSHVGALTTIAGSTQPLLDAALPTAPRQIGFNPSGKLLMVTVLATAAGPPPVGGTANTIDTFPVHNGVAGAGTAHNSTSNFPFAFAFDSYGDAVVAQVNSFAPGAGTAQTYSVTNSGTMTPISGLSTNGFAACWVVITSNQRYAYVVNTGNGVTTTQTPGSSIAEYKLSPSGKLTLIGNIAPPTQYLKTDDALTPDDRYLYVVSPLEASPASQTAGGTNSLIDVYAVRHGGTLRFVGSTPDIPSPGLSGLAVN